MWCVCSNKSSPLWFDCVISSDSLHRGFQNLFFLNVFWQSFLGASWVGRSRWSPRWVQQRCKAAGLLPENTSVLRGQGHVKVHVHGHEGGGTPLPVHGHMHKAWCRSRWEAHVSAFDAQVKRVPSQGEFHPPPHPKLLPPGFTFYQVHRWKMLPQDHAYEYAEQCCGRRAAPCPCRNANKVAPLLSQRGGWGWGWGGSVFCLRTCLGVEENRGSVWGKSEGRVAIFSWERFRLGVKTTAGV